MNWKTEITEIYELAALHSWCNQVNELITDFNNNHKRNKSIIDYLKSILKEKNHPNEYYILSLVLLNYQECPTEDIIELSINSLYSKLNKNDILFFKEHLFYGNFPLSSDLSEDITNRSFLSPKVAIKKAMKIDSVISKNNPINTVLYMNFILSRMDMNEENRAMVAFLLLRVDVELPKSLKERVFKYLLEYKDIIQELLQEEMGESIQIEDISSIVNKISKIEIIENQTNLDKDIEPEQIEKDLNITVNNLKNEKVSGFKLDNIKSPDLNISDEPKGISNNQKLKFSKKKKKAVLENEEKSIKNNSKDINKSTKNKVEDEIIDKLNNTTNKETNIKTKTSKRKIKKIDIKKLVKNNSKKKKNVTNNTKSFKNLEILNPGESDKSDELNNINNSNNKTGKENKSWQIGLKQNKQILESILQGLGKIKHNNILSKKIDGFNKDSEKNIVVSNNGKRKYYIAISIILLLIIVPLVLKNITKTTPLSTHINESDSLTQKIQVNEPESLNGSGEDLISELKEKAGKIPEDFPVNISIKGNKIIWVVLEGESITDLFFALQDNQKKLQNTKLEKLSNMTWDDFFNIFKNNNTVRDSYHIIYPSEIFVIPID